MRTVYAKHEPYTTGQLAEVVQEMIIHGAPTIRVVEFKTVPDAFFALEGSHRLAAAHHLGIEPKLVVEQPEGDETLDAFWERVTPLLPFYFFEHVHVLNLASFEVP